LLSLSYIIKTDFLGKYYKEATYSYETYKSAWKKAGVYSAVAFRGSFRIHEILCRHKTEYDLDFTLFDSDVTVKNFKNNNGLTGKVLHVSIKCPKEYKTRKVVVVDVNETSGSTCPV
jgi:hypothetical protein